MKQYQEEVGRPLLLVQSVRSWLGSVGRVHWPCPIHRLDFAIIVFRPLMVDVDVVLAEIRTIDDCLFDLTGHMVPRPFAVVAFVETVPNGLAIECSQ